MQNGRGGGVRGDAGDVAPSTSLGPSAHASSRNTNTPVLVLIAEFKRSGPRKNMPIYLEMDHPNPNVLPR